MLSGLKENSWFKMIWRVNVVTFGIALVVYGILYLTGHFPTVPAIPTPADESIAQLFPVFSERWHDVLVLPLFITVLFCVFRWAINLSDDVNRDEGTSASLGFALAALLIGLLAGILFGFANGAVVSAVIIAGAGATVLAAGTLVLCLGVCAMSFAYTCQYVSAARKEKQDSLLKIAADSIAGAATWIHNHSTAYIVRFFRWLVGN